MDCVVEKKEGMRFKYRQMGIRFTIGGHIIQGDLQKKMLWSDSTPLHDSLSSTRMCDFLPTYVHSHRD